jgi:hypothetical protein
MRGGKGESKNQTSSLSGAEITLSLTTLELVSPKKQYLALGHKRIFTRLLLLRFIPSEERKARGESGAVA